MQEHEVSYNSAISACKKGKEWGKALQLFVQMQQSEVQVDAISYHSAINACEKDEDWGKALQLLVQCNWFVILL